VSELVHIDRVNKRYGGVEALSDVSFSVSPGELVGLIGANGAGKSTLLNIIGGESPSNSGEIRLDGKPLVGRPHERARRGLARTFQHPRVALDMTVFDNIAVGLAVKEMCTTWRAISLPLWSMLTGARPDPKPVIEACNQVGLDGILRPARNLSFGELRLLEVARALVQRPRVILLDEPFPGLEDDGLHRLTSILRSLSAKGQTIILVDHNVTIVQSLVERIVLLARGRVVFDGPVAECVTSRVFRDEYVGSIE
jgi:branched-chain amino acid transport system ATP-binding protein